MYPGIVTPLFTITTTFRTAPTTQDRRSSPDHLHQEILLCRGLGPRHDRTENLKPPPPNQRVGLSVDESHVHGSV